MSGFEFDKRISWGNIITLAVLGVGALAGYLDMRGDVRALAARQIQADADTAVRVAEFKSTSSIYDARIRAVELAQASQSSDLRAIQAGLTEIKDQLRRMTGPRD